jgi:exosortase
MVSAAATPFATKEDITRRLAWFSILVAICYAPVLIKLIANWYIDSDMGHGFFVPLIAGYIIWQQKDELMAMKPRPSWWGLPLVLWGGAQLIVGTLGVELFTERVAFVITVVGLILALCGFEILKKIAFPLFLLLFMIPIPAIIYNKITFPLQILASRLADEALSVLGIPVMREGNILELPNQRLSVVEACSGIRSLLSLTFLSLVYGHFFEKRLWVRGLLFFSTIPIAIIANGGRVTITGILTQVNPALAEGFFHESTGWVIFMLALAIMVGLHQGITWMLKRMEARHAV